MTRRPFYRSTDARYVETAFSGKGGLYAGGRWHEQGFLVVYAATTSSLALLEWRVHTNMLRLQRDYVLIEASIPTDCVQHLPDTELPEDWQHIPPPPSTQAIGATFLQQSSQLALSVPSVINPRERNLVINPVHPDMHRIEVVATAPLQIDRRLFY